MEAYKLAGVERVKKKECGTKAHNHQGLQPEIPITL